MEGCVCIVLIMCILSVLGTEEKFQQKYTIDQFCSPGFSCPSTSPQHLNEVPFFTIPWRPKLQTVVGKRKFTRQRKRKSCRTVLAKGCYPLPSETVRHRTPRKLSKTMANELNEKIVTKTQGLRPLTFMVLAILDQDYRSSPVVNTVNLFSLFFLKRKQASWRFYQRCLERMRLC